MTFVIYFCKKFSSVSLIALLFFSFVLGLVDLFLNLWRYLAENVEILDILKIFFLYLPKTVSFALPLAVLFAVAFVLSDLYAKNELTAVFASGVSLFSFALPVLGIAAVLSLGLFFFEDKIVVPTYQQKVELQNKVLKIAANKDNTNPVVIADGGKTIYKANYYDDNVKTLYNLLIVKRGENFELDSIVRAQRAIFNGGKWQLEDFVCYRVNGNTLELADGFTDYSFDQPEDAFAFIQLKADQVCAAEAKKQIAYLERAGLPYAEALSVYYQKFSFPFIVFIVVFLSLGLSGKTQKNVLLVSLLLCISAAVSYYVLQMLTMLLAQFEYISPLAGAWLPVFVYLALSCVLLRHART